MKKELYFILVLLFILNTVALILNYKIFLDNKKQIMEIVDLKQKKLILEKKETLFFELEKQVKENESSLEEIKKMFLSFENPLSFVEFLENEAKREGLSLKITIAKHLATKDSLPYFLFNLNLSGSFGRFFSFLNRLKNAPYLIKIEKISISKLEKELNFEVSFKAFGK